MIKKILLINPPAIVKESWIKHIGSFPLGLAYIAAVLQQNHYDVKIIDCFIEGFFNRTKIDNGIVQIGMSDDEIIKSVTQYSPDLVGVSIQFSCQLSSALHVSSLIKKVNKTIVTVAGGNHASAAPESIDGDGFDWIIIGEGEFRLLNLIQTINSDNFDKMISGIIPVSEAIQNRCSSIKNGFVENLDSLPFPLYRLLSLEEYWRISGNIRWINMIATRGCPYRCVFCSIKTIMGKKVRYRSVDNIMKEIILLKREFDVQQIYFEDDNLTFDIEWAKELFRRIIQADLGLEIYFRNGIRADRIDLELLKLMKKAGARIIWFAPESGSQETLDKIIKKNLRLEDCEKTVQMAKKVGLEVQCFLVIGFPEETLEDVHQTIRYGHKLKKLGCDSFWVSCAVPYPGTELFENCIRRGLISKNNIDYQSMSTLDSIISNEWFSSDEIKNIREQAMFELNRLDFYDYLRQIHKGIILLFLNPVLFFKRFFGHLKRL